MEAYARLFGALGQAIYLRQPPRKKGNFDIQKQMFHKKNEKEKDVCVNEKANSFRVNGENLEFKLKTMKSSKPETVKFIFNFKNK